MLERLQMLDCLPTSSIKTRQLPQKNAPTSSKICSDLREKVDSSRVGEPAFLMIVMCGEFAYRRKDGVFVVPIGCLKD